MVAEEAVLAVLQVANILKRYYTSEEYLHAVTATPSWNLSDNAPTIYMPVDKAGQAPFVQATPRPAGDRQDIPAATFYYLLDSWIGPSVGNDALNNASRAAAAFFTLDHKDVPGTPSHIM